MSFSQLLSRRYQNKLDSTATEYLGYIVEGGKRMEAQVKDLLDYSRVSTRGRPFEAVECDSIVEKVLENLQIQIQESGALINMDTLPTISADPVQLSMVFQNLIGNAIKFHKDGVRPDIRISAEETDGWWTFAVKDNGIGIDPAFYSKIFVIFQRLHAMNKYPGTGVGLAIVKKIVERQEDGSG